MANKNNKISLWAVFWREILAYLVIIMDKLEFQKKIGEKIRAQRKRQGLSQEQLAELSDMHHTFISNVERGKVSASAYSLFKIASALEMDISDLFNFGVSLDDDDLNHSLSFISSSIRKMNKDLREIYLSAIRGMLQK